MSTTPQPQQPPDDGLGFDPDSVDWFASSPTAEPEKAEKDLRSIFSAPNGLLPDDLEGAPPEVLEIIAALDEAAASGNRDALVNVLAANVAKSVPIAAQGYADALAAGDHEAAASLSGILAQATRLLMPWHIIQHVDTRVADGTATYEDGLIRAKAEVVLQGVFNDNAMPPILPVFETGEPRNDSQSFDPPAPPAVADEGQVAKPDDETGAY